MTTLTDTTSPFPSTLITPRQLHDALQPPRTSRIVLLAAGAGRLLPSFQAHHIPYSVFFDMSTICDTESPYPQTLPIAPYFASRMEALRIKPSDVLVVYDALEVGMYSSPRVAWMCRFFGYKNVHVLNNFPKWVQEGYPVSSASRDFELGIFAGSEQDNVFQPDLSDIISFEELRDLVVERVRTLSDVTDGESVQQYQILDARPPERFQGTHDETDTGLRLGHMPSAVNIPLAAMLDSSKAFLSKEDLRSVFEKAGVKEDVPVVLTCNSGVTAAALGLGLEEAGYAMKKRIYDGSWMEWTRSVGDDLVARGE